MSARHHRVRVLAVVSLFVMVINGCVSAAVQREATDLSFDAAGTSSEESRRASVGGSRLTSAQLASTDAWWTGDAVVRLRPDFLRGSARGPYTGRPEIALYLNGARAGDASMLNLIPLREVREIVFLHPAEARLQFGPACPCASGALLVTTRTMRER
jgi:hypothetical protein